MYTAELAALTGALLNTQVLGPTPALVKRSLLEGIAVPSLGAAMTLSQQQCAQRAWTSQSGNMCTPDYDLPLL